MSSRSSISQMQRNDRYRPSGAIAAHILNETQEIDSSEPVLEINGSFWTASKFAKRYYRVVVQGEQWFCSASDPRVAVACKASVQAYLIRRAS